MLVLLKKLLQVHQPSQKKTKNIYWVHIHFTERCWHVRGLWHLGLHAVTFSFRLVRVSCLAARSNGTNEMNKSTASSSSSSCDQGLKRSSQDVASVGPLRRNSFLKAATAARCRQPTGTASLVPSAVDRVGPSARPVPPPHPPARGCDLRRRIWRVMPTSSSSILWSSNAETSINLQWRRAARLFPSEYNRHRIDWNVIMWVRRRSRGWV